MDKASIATYFFLSSSALLANPQSPAVIAGDASFEILSPELLEIVVSDRSILEWKDFSIEAGETVRFTQPNSSSVSLNRVIESYPSRLMGNLEANGQLLLINPHGILVGKEARIDMGSFIASTLDIKSFDAEFTFEGSSDTSVINLGEIHALEGNVILIGGRVTNEGSIIAKNGLAGLVSGSEVLFKPAGLERIYVRGKSFSDVFVHETTHSGSISSLDAYVLGDRVLVMENSIIDVSGDFGGGKALIGGDYQGTNENIRNASQTWVGPNAIIDASAKSKGNGGKIIVWADDWTLFSGNGIAQGGSQEGNGGFVEISGHDLHFSGVVSTAAPFGKTGILLLDPADVTINATGPTSNWNPVCPTGFIGNPTNVVILNTDLQNALNACNVVINTSTSTGGGAGNILVSNPVMWDSANSLTLQTTTGNITCNASIQNAGSGNVILLANTGQSVFLNNNSTTQSVSVGSQQGITQVGATATCNQRPHLTLMITGTGHSPGAQLGYFSTAPDGMGRQPTGNINVSCGNLSLNCMNAGSTIGVGIGHGSGDLSGLGITGTLSGNINIDASGTIDITSGPSASDAIIGSGGRNITTPFSVTSNICVRAGGNINIKNRNVSTSCGAVIGSRAQNNNLSSLNGTITVSSVGNINMETFGSGGFAGIGPVTGTNQSIATTDISVTCTGTLSMTTHSNASGSFSLIGTRGAPNLHQNISVSAGGAITMTHDATTPDTTSFCAIGGGAISGSIVNIVGGVVKVFAGGGCTLKTTGTNAFNQPLFIGYRTSTQNINASTSLAVMGDLTITPTNSATGIPIRISSPGGDVNVSAQGTIRVDSTSGVGANNQSFIATTRTTGGFTRVWAGGQLNVVSPNTFIIGTTAGAATTGTSIDLRSGLGLQVLNGFTTQTGSITISPNYYFDASDLWTINNSQLQTVCKFGPLTDAVVVNPCLCVNAPTVGANSTAVTGDCGDLNLNGQLFRTTSGAITIESSGNSNVTPNCPGQAAVTIGVGGTFQITTTSGKIQVLKLQNITNNQALTTTSSIAITANQNLTVNAGSPISSTGAMPVTLIAGNTPALVGTLTINANISSAGGDIVLQSGKTFNCSMQSTGSSINHVAGAVNPGAGNLTVNANFDLKLSSPSNPSMTASTGFFHTQAGRDTILTNTTISKTGAGVTGTTDLLMRSGRNMTLTNSNILAAPSFVTLVVDNCFPITPLIGPGAFTLDATSTLVSDPGQHLRIFTANRAQNTISGTLNGQFFVPGTIFVDSATEVWCQYFALPFPYPFNNLGDPYTIFYKNCLGAAANQANIIVSQFLIDLHPFNEFPGWLEEFYLKFRGSESIIALADEPYYFRRRELKLFNLPKYYTIITNDTYLERTKEGDLRVGED